MSVVSKTQGQQALWNKVDVLIQSKILIWHSFLIGVGWMWIQERTPKVRMLERDWTPCWKCINHSRSNDQHNKGGVLYDHLLTSKNLHFDDELDMRTNSIVSLSWPNEKEKRQKWKEKSFSFLFFSNKSYVILIEMLQFKVTTCTIWICWLSRTNCVCSISYEKLVQGEGKKSDRLRPTYLTTQGKPTHLEERRAPQPVQKWG